MKVLKCKNIKILESDLHGLLKGIVQGSFFMDLYGISIVQGSFFMGLYGISIVQGSFFMDLYGISIVHGSFFMDLYGISIVQGSFFMESALYRGPSLWNQHCTGVLLYGSIWN